MPQIVQDVVAVPTLDGRLADMDKIRAAIDDELAEANASLSLLRLQGRATGAHCREQRDAARNTAQAIRRDLGRLRIAAMVARLRWAGRRAWLALQLLTDWLLRAVAACLAWVASASRLLDDAEDIDKPRHRVRDR
jgi:hypothetical protein